MKPNPDLTLKPLPLTGTLTVILRLTLTLTLSTISPSKITKNQFLGQKTMLFELLSKLILFEYQQNVLLS